MTLAQEVAETLEECGQPVRGVSDDDHYARQHLETTGYTSSEATAILYENKAIVTNVMGLSEGWYRLWFGRIETLERNLQLEDREYPR